MKDFFAFLHHNLRVKEEKVTDLDGPQEEDIIDMGALGGGLAAGVVVGVGQGEVHALLHDEATEHQVVVVPVLGLAQQHGLELAVCHPFAVVGLLPGREGPGFVVNS